MTSTLTEQHIFNLCTEKPIRLQKSALNLSFVKDPAGSDGGSAEQEIEDRKVFRLYQMMWSGLTKQVNSLVHSHAKAVEIPSFAIFAPVVEQWTDYRDPLDKGPITKRTY